MTQPPPLDNNNKGPESWSIFPAAVSTALWALTPAVPGALLAKGAIYMGCNAGSTLCKNYVCPPGKTCKKCGLVQKYKITSKNGYCKGCENVSDTKLLKQPILNIDNSGSQGTVSPTVINPIVQNILNQSSQKS